MLMVRPHPLPIYEFELTRGYAHADEDAQAHVIGAAEDAIFDWWNMHSHMHAAHSDLEPDTDSDAYEAAADDFEARHFLGDSGLSAWDQLGEGYESDAAKIGAYILAEISRLFADNMLVILAKKLSESDLAICRAFAYKVRTHTTDEGFDKLPLAFPNITALPSLDKMRSGVTFLSGFQPEHYDCCINACCCFVGPHANLSKCPYCQQARYRPDG